MSLETITTEELFQQVDALRYALHGVAGQGLVPDAHMLDALKALESELAQRGASDSASPRRDNPYADLDVK